MGKVYNTRQKHLITIHKPIVPEDTQEEPKDHEEVKVTIKPSKILKPWNPINVKFYHGESDDDTSDEDDEKTDTDNGQRGETRDIAWNISDEENIEPDWDNSPEQYQLQEENIQEEDHVLLPRRLFAEVKRGKQ